MTYTTLIHSARLTGAQQDAVLAEVPGRLSSLGAHYRLYHAEAIGEVALAELRETLNVDINTLPEGFDPGRVRLIVTDMDSTLIAIECIDELADMLGLKSEVAAITEAAMRGELEFAEALKKRVALLEGLPESDLERVYAERLRYSPGAAILMSEARRRDVKTAVVSGGFTYFTERVKAELGLNYALANRLETRNKRLTGRVLGEICGAEAKAEFLLNRCRELGISTGQCIAIGDGANDLKMLSAAGLGVAYHAKPKVREQADVAIDRGGLECVADFLVAETR
ncbi:phosphoserine phosphatase SerB [Methylococcus sp. EFPC2]|uniref:phosphoserine phosphatase SerB n=1 Tax=Methylococcus sp. EFPC2 TaxID=2812648 RepID=UPI001966D11F|nr:phosphoserine phosphatase SerB [Methylococcus sp. EFPC2]QSA98466.1 phosphoserine phosphatase SerB [Methylococcus sp. EFPC2]